MISRTTVTLAPRGEVRVATSQGTVYLSRDKAYDLAVAILCRVDDADRQAEARRLDTLLRLSPADVARNLNKTERHNLRRASRGKSMSRTSRATLTSLRLVAGNGLTERGRVVLDHLT